MTWSFNTPPPVAPPPKRRITGAGLAVVLALVGLGLAACMVGLGLALINGDGPGKDRPPATTPPTGTRATPDPGARPAAPGKKTAARQAVIRAGDWLVGEDVTAGTYKTPGAEPGVITACVWSVKASDADGAEVLDVGALSKPDQQGRVRLRDGQLFETSGCKDWVRQ